MSEENDNKKTMYGVITAMSVVQIVIVSFVTMVLLYQLSHLFDELNRVEQLARKAFFRIETQLNQMHTK